MTEQSWIPGEECVERPQVSDKAKCSWVVAHRFWQKRIERENISEKWISETKSVRTVPVKEDTGNLMTIIQQAGHNAGPLSDQTPQTEWKKGNTNTFL